MPSQGVVTVRPIRRVHGRVTLPGDKSISHRYALLAAIADGPSQIANYAPGADCASTLGCLSALGVDVRRHGTSVSLIGRGIVGLQRPAGDLDAGNSGSTMRMLAGVLAGHRFTATITGDASLRRRPMRRVIAPLAAMGATLEAQDGRPPLRITGGRLHGITFQPEVPSAQVKSAVLFAGLHADGTTAVLEPVPTRDHTERAVVAFGGRVVVSGHRIEVSGGQRLEGRELHVPGDISSAAFWAVAAAALPGSDLTLIDVGLNPTRTALLDVLARAGAQVEPTIERTEAHEPVGSVRIRHGNLVPLTITPAEVPALIDELPVLAALATHGGELSVTGASELRVKESDRISALAAGLRALGAEIEEQPDGFHVRGRRRLSGGTADAAGDHRLAMAFAVAALGAHDPSTILGAEAVAVSYPQFFEVLGTIGA